MSEQLTFIPASEAAALAGVTPETIRNLCKAGTIRYQMRGNLFYPCKEDVEQYTQTISEVHEIEQSIEKYKEEIENDKDLIEQKRFDMRERLIAIDMFPHRIERIKELLAALLQQYETGLTPREVDIMIAGLKGETFRETGDKMFLTREKVRAIWYKALNKYAKTYNLLQQKDSIIESRDKTIAELQKKIENLENGSEALKRSNQYYILIKPISDCHFSYRTEHGLIMGGVNTVADLVKIDRHKLSGFRNLGKKSISEIEDWLTKHDLSLSMTFPI